MHDTLNRTHDTLNTYKIVFAKYTINDKINNSRWSCFYFPTSFQEVFLSLYLGRRPRLRIRSYNSRKLWHIRTVNLTFQNHNHGGTVYIMCQYHSFHSSKYQALAFTNLNNILHNLTFTILQYKLHNTLIEYVQSQVDLGIIVIS